MKILHQIYNYFYPKLNDISIGRINITDISYPSKIQCMASIVRNADTLKDIKNQSHELCAEAIRRRPETFEYVLNQTSALSFMAVIKRPELLIFVKNQSEEICIAAFQSREYYGCILQYVKNQTLDICLAAVHRNGLEIEFVDKKFQCKEMHIKAVQSYSGALLHIKNPSDDLIEIALKKDPHLIAAIHQNIDFCIKALEWAKDMPGSENTYLLIKIVPNEEKFFITISFITNLGLV
jgi:hypothetical protein